MKARSFLLELIALSDVNKIRSFLLKLKYSLQDGGVELNTQKKENEDTLLKLGFTPKQALFELNKLTPKHYLSGPEPDNAKLSGEVWKFIMEVEGLKIYIKIRLVSNKKYTKGVCISFHESKYL